MPKRKRRVRRILNCTPSRDTERDWQFEDAVNAELLAAPPVLPKSKNLRRAWWKIADQGSTGSCVGWAAADSVIRWHFVEADRLLREQLLSPRFIWMASKETDRFVSQPTTFIEMAGTSLKAALDIARKFGTVRDSVLPFKAGTLYPKSAKVFYATAAQMKIASYFNLGTNLHKWRTWLASHGPILTRLGVDATWDNADQTGGKLDAYQPETVRGGHAIALVGYRPGRFIVRNSWGTGWGDEGFGYASEDYAEAAFTEAYGVSV